MGQSGSLLPSPKDMPASERAAVLPGGPSLASFAARLRGSGKVVVLAGAGISVSAGIPDFRSPGSGLYHNLARYHLSRAEDIFTLGFFGSEPRPFFHLARELYPGNFAPTLTHYFLRLLQDKGKLLRIYTQNIDTLERVAGLTEEKLVEAHGSFASATCRSCGKHYSQAWMETALFGAGGVAGAAAAKKAAAAAAAASAAAGGAASIALEEVVVPHCAEDGCDGVVKPDIVFFGEDLPARFGALVKGDCREADALIVMGTSLTVAPVCTIPSMVPATCPRLLINRDAVNVESAEADTGAPVPKTKSPATGEEEGDDDDDGDGAGLNEVFRRLATGDRSSNTAFRFFLRDNYRDVFLGGDCDAGVEALARELGWLDELYALAGRTGPGTPSAAAPGSGGTGGGAGGSGGGSTPSKGTPSHGGASVSSATVASPATGAPASAAKGTTPAATPPAKPHDAAALADAPA